MTDSNPIVITSFFEFLYLIKQIGTEVNPSVKIVLSILRTIIVNRIVYNYSEPLTVDHQ